MLVRSRCRTSKLTASSPRPTPSLGTHATPDNVHDLGPAARHGSLLLRSVRLVRQAGLFPLQPGSLLQAEPVRDADHLALRAAHHLARLELAASDRHHRDPARYRPGLAAQHRFDYAATGRRVRPLRDARRSCSAYWPSTFRLPLAAPTELTTHGCAPWAIFTSPVGFILPGRLLDVLSVAVLSRFMRGAVFEVLVQDYVRTAQGERCCGSADSLQARLSQRARTDRHDPRSLDPGPTLAGRSSSRTSSTTAGSASADLSPRRTSTYPSCSASRCWSRS